jgi:hypothetical protein
MYIKKYCCNKNTHYANKMKNCESTLHTIAGYISPNNSIDHIVTLETNPSIVVSNETILNSLITDHKPIFCKVNNIPILSWNIEGLCNIPSETHTRFIRIKNVLSEIHKQYPSVIFMFQELFLQDRLTKNNDKMGIERLQSLFHHSNYTYIYDGYTGGVIIPTYLYYKNIQLIERKESNKKCMVLYIRASQPFYLINMHLKAIHNPITKDKTHIGELSNILFHIKHKIKKGIVCIGDYNNENVLYLFEESIKLITE